MSFTLLKDTYSKFTLFIIFFLSSLLLGNGLGLYSVNVVAIQQENEAEVNIDIKDLENKCNKHSPCENNINIDNSKKNININGVSKNDSSERPAINIRVDINNNQNFTANQNVSLDITRTEEPKASSLTVKKQIFGCDNLSGNNKGDEKMDCLGIGKDYPTWLSCNDQRISDSFPCSHLPEDLFDIEVLDQNTKIEFKGSQQGTTMENIEPGTYTIHEIKHQEVNYDQLKEDNTIFQICIENGFADGGKLYVTDYPPVMQGEYIICFEYVDEQGNVCSQTTVNDGEDNVCIVKNYIWYYSSIGV